MTTLSWTKGEEPRSNPFFIFNIDPMGDRWGSKCLLGEGSDLEIGFRRRGLATMMPETLVVLSAVSAVVGVVLGEVFDVWYDLTHAEAVSIPDEPDRIIEAVQFAPERPLAFGYAKVYFREVLATPDAFEHYHWGLWLAANAISMYSLLSPLTFLMLGLALTLILDENRRGLADKPFGVGKPYFATCSFIGVMLSVLLILRMLTVSTAFELGVAVVALAAPFVILAWLWISPVISRYREHLESS